MRIVVNDIAASAGGGLSILKQLYAYLIESNDQNEWYFLLAENTIEETEHIHILTFPEEKKSRWKRLLFDFVYGRNIINELRPDVILYLQNTLVSGIKVPQVMYMDQSIPFQNEKKFSFLKKEERAYAVYQHLIGILNKQACKKADCTIVQTEWLKKAIVRKCRVSDSRIVKIHPESAKIPEQYRAKNINPSVFFYPASGAIYKNHACLFKALDYVEKPCSVILTMDAPKDVPSACRFVGQISQEDVYRHMCSEVLVFPSYIESFGLPLEEARTIGTIILASDTDFSREVLDGYENAYYFNPFDPEELGKLINKVLTGEIKQKKQRMVQQKKSAGWSNVIKVLENVLNENTSSILS